MYRWIAATATLLLAWAATTATAGDHLWIQRDSYAPGCVGTPRYEADFFWASTCFPDTITGSSTLYAVNVANNSITVCSWWGNVLCQGTPDICTTVGNGQCTSSSVAYTYTWPVYPDATWISQTFSVACQNGINKVWYFPTGVCLNQYRPGLGYALFTFPAPNVIRSCSYTVPTCDSPGPGCSDSPLGVCGMTGIYAIVQKGPPVPVESSTGSGALPRATHDVFVWVPTLLLALVVQQLL